MLSFNVGTYNKNFVVILGTSLINDLSIYIGGTSLKLELRVSNLLVLGVVFLQTVHFS